MSVTDPLIKDIKGAILKLHNEGRSCGAIYDSSPNLLGFCQILETIFTKGFTSHLNLSYFNKTSDVFTCICNTSPNVHDSAATFAFEAALETTKSCKNVRTPDGKFRLLIRCCLEKKCVHVPLESLVNSGKNRTFYHQNSVIGDEILSAILLSALLQCGKFNFRLALKNSSFLDWTWQLPEISELELVPCSNLGIAVSFSNDKAVIVDVEANSVASDSGQICRGDVLDNLNGVHIDSSCKGGLNAIFRTSKGRPVRVVILKALSNQEIFPPIKQLLDNLKIDMDKVKNRESSEEHTDAPSVQPKIAFPTAGYSATYLGSVEVGDRGNVKQIEKAIKNLVANEGSAAKIAVTIEVGEMNVIIADNATNKPILKHTYMQISSCGSLPHLPNYFAYISGDESCESASKFCCYGFHTTNTNEACAILQSIGQGFHRTHFAV